MTGDHDAPARPEHRWPAVVAILLVLVLWVLLPGFFLASFTWVAAAACILLLVPLIALNPKRLSRQTSWSRILDVGIAVLLILFNQVLLVRLVNELLTAPPTEGILVLVAALQLWATNCIVFGVLYWQLDAQGPVARATAGRHPRVADFQFPQDTVEGFSEWRPRFFDYLYLSITAGIAFSAADALPLSRRAKAFMAIEAISAYIISVLVIARAVSAVT